MGSVYRNPGRRVWMMKFYRHGVAIRQSSETTRKMQAQQRCDDLETDARRGLPLTKDVGKILWEAAVADLLADYANNQQSSAADVARRLTLHLTPVFRGSRLAAITPADVRAYTQDRREAGAAAGTVNRELTILKRMFTLAVQGGRLLYQPHIALLAEHNVRAGFFEREQFLAVRRHLPAPLRPVVTLAYVTGWRIDSEVLPLEWSRVDLEAGEIRLEADTTKNDEPRVFPLTVELVAVLAAQQRARKALLKAGHLVPWVFFRLVAKGRGGRTYPKPILRFNKAWKAACEAAQVPGRIPHDFRRTAIRNMVRRGVPEAVAMTLTGHKTRSVFARYNIVSPGDLQEARAKLEGVAAGTPAGTPRRIPAARRRSTG